MATFGSIGNLFEPILGWAQATFELTGPPPSRWIEWHNSFVADFVCEQGMTVEDLLAPQSGWLRKECMLQELTHFMVWLRREVDQLLDHAGQAVDQEKVDQDREFFILAAQFDPDIANEVEVSRRQICEAVAYLYKG